MQSALIGYTGFVGSNLLRQHAFTDSYNSKNIHEATGKHYDLVVCAGAPAAKWIANRNPEGDYANIVSLIKCLATMNVKTFVLVSTVDVYPSPVDLDEDDLPAEHGNHAYGRHRLLLEKFVRETFATSATLRLPGLFGEGLKKNIIYDFLNDNNLGQIDSRGVYQFYSLDHLWGDICKALTYNIHLLNVASEPLSVEEVYEVVVGGKFDNHLEHAPARYSFRSKHAKFWGGKEGYLYTKAQVAEDLNAFAQAERNRRGSGS